MTMYGLYNSKGILISTTSDFDISSMTFQLLAQGYVELTGKVLEKVKNARNNLVSRLQKDIR